MAQVPRSERAAATDETWTTTTPKEKRATRSISSPEKSDSPQKVRKMPQRKALTKNACGDCRRSKCKCDGKRPVCGRCSNRETECNYDVEEDGITKMQQLAQQLKSVDEGHNLLLELFDILQQAPDDLAAALLARIRFGEEVPDIVTSLRPLVSQGEIPSLDAMQEQERNRVEQQEEEMQDWFPGASSNKPWNSWSRRCEDSEAAQPDAEAHMWDGPTRENFVPSEMKPG